MTPQQKWNLKHRDVILRISRKFIKTVKGRHASLRAVLRKEKVPKSDLLWNLNFYAELIKDGLCHYCLGSLNPTSHGLDCKENKIGHRCFNVVPCCRACNWKKMKDVTYEEMMLLAPILRIILEKRKSGR
jgi:hypothetical protein